jgi:ABC-type branched-subunit amino acid transport system permease subunit
MQALCFALFACAFNLLIGYVGLLSFGHAMFLGIAGYVSAHLLKVGTISIGPSRLGWTLDFGPWPPEWAILAGAASAGVLGLVVGLLAIRRQGIYFAMITLALAQMVYFFCVEAPFTHGEDGIQSVPPGRLFGLFDLSNVSVLYTFVAVVFLLAFLLIYRTVNSPFGEILKAIRENEARAVSLGYKVDDYKLAAFVLSATLAGLAGALKAIVDVGRRHPDDARRRARHDLRSGRGCRRRRRHAAISGCIRAMGDGDPGHHLRRLRARLPARHRRRDRPCVQAFALEACVPSPACGRRWPAEPVG